MAWRMPAVKMSTEKSNKEEKEVPRSWLKEESTRAAIH